MKDYFFSISKILFGLIEDKDLLILNFDAEIGDYIRFNHSKIRQVGNVKQITLTLDFIRKKTTISSTMRLNGDLKKDTKLVENALNFLKRELSDLPSDPYLMYAKEKNSTEKLTVSENINNKNITERIIESFSNLDMVGILSSGYIYRGFANSLGQTNWHENQSFNFDWSIYTKSGKAVKQNYSDLTWQQNIFEQILNEGKQKLIALENTEIKLQPNDYKVYLSPHALNEIIDMLCWGGFSYKAHKIGTSPLHLMSKGEFRLHNTVHISENLANGINPNFHRDGFIKPIDTELIVKGDYKKSLISPRSGQEYSIQHNGAEYHETPVAINMKAGKIKHDEILKTLSDGIYISNLWYLNFSDRNKARITGLTRFGCFKVKDGEYLGPINTMRFDETIYNILGENLIGLTNNQQLMMDCSTYEERSTFSSCLPGALVDGFKMTL
ncbi:MAG: metallopeptidase TldD-related protein [Pseudomonadota bacterium]|nr:metallopeptidase TldD-related protein [Pseudomonadota bacterium]